MGRLRRFVELALVLGVLGFGGGYAIAQRVRHRLVAEWKWLDDEAFMEAFAVASSLPGTTATNLLTLLGYRFAGLRGALGAAIAFLAPSVALMVAFGVAYGRLRQLPALGYVLDGMGIATVGVVAAVALDMRRGAMKSRLGWLLGLAATALLVTRSLNLLEVVALAGLSGAIWMRPARRAPEELEQKRADEREELPPESLGRALVALPAAAAALPASLALLVVFGRIGIATFGGGVAMISPIEHEVVHVHGWLDESAFADAIVLGQITPGPIAISATFIGYRVAGLPGAALATLGMFAPPFALTIVAARSIGAFRASRVLRGFLAGVAPAIVGAIAAAAVAMFHTSVHSWPQCVIAGAAFALLVLRPKLSPLLPIAAGGAAEALLRTFA